MTPCPATDFKEAIVNNFLKGVKWSPDGTCLLSNSEDHCVRMFEPGDLHALTSGQGSIEKKESNIPSGSPPALSIPHGGTVYDFCWYPGMRSDIPSTSCFFTTSRDHPIQLWDAFTGEMRSSYRAYNNADELTAALSLCPDPFSNNLFCGFDECIRIFDISRPGREYSTLRTRKLTGKRKRQRTGQQGVVSCMEVAPDLSKLLCAGSFSGEVALYDQSSFECMSTLECHPTGLTCLRFSPDGRYLFTGARMSDDIRCWDIRDTSRLLGVIPRTCRTNMKMSFDLDYSGRFLASGSEAGHVQLVDLTQPGDPSTLQLTPVVSLRGHDDIVQGVSFHPSFSRYFPFLATCSGQRRFELPTKSISHTFHSSLSRKCKFSPRSRRDLESDAPADSKRIIPVEGNTSSNSSNSVGNRPGSAAMSATGQSSYESRAACDSESENDSDDDGRGGDEADGSQRPWSASLRHGSRIDNSICYWRVI
jgi:WD40 repeat protein